MLHHEAAEILRADTYRGLADAVEAGDHDRGRSGSKVILPSSFGVSERSFAPGRGVSHGKCNAKVLYEHEGRYGAKVTGDPRYIQQACANAMAVCTKYGKPDACIIMTC